jgi:hypothetical protein
MAKKLFYTFNDSNYLFFNPMNEGPSTQEVLNIMLDVMQQVNDSDDATFVLKMKLANNIEFLVDQLMAEYEQRIAK